MGGNVECDSYRRGVDALRYTATDLDDAFSAE